MFLAQQQPEICRQNMKFQFSGYFFFTFFSSQINTKAIN